MNPPRAAPPRYGILGPLRIDGDPDVGGPVPKAVLIRLLVEPGVLVTVDELVDAGWSDQTPANAAKNLQIYVARMRKVVPFGLIASGSGGYLATCPRQDVDAFRYEAIISEARTAANIGAIDSAIDRYVAADDLWRGSVLVDVRYASFAQPWIAFFEQLREGAREEEMALRLERGEGPDLLPRLHSGVEQAPLRERRWGQLMLALYQAGQQVEALRTCQRLRQLFAEEMGLDPSPDIEELELRILRHEVKPGTSGSDPTRIAGGRLEGGHRVALVFRRSDTGTGDGVEASPHGDLRSALAEGRRRLAAAPHASAAIALSSNDSPVLAERRARALLGLSDHGELAISQTAHSALLDDGVDVAGFVPVGWADLGEGAATAVFAERVVGHRGSPDGQQPGRTNMAPYGNAFLGRDAELAALAQLLGSVGMVTLVGPGGIGKTRLAREYAFQHRRDHPGGTWLIDLASCPSDKAAWSLIGTTLRVGTADPVDIASWLSARESLLILDNCEEVRPAVCELEDAIRSEANGVEIIATSRIPIGSVAERVLRVGALGSAASGESSTAVELFKARADESGVAAGASHRLVADICQRLDGIPLAIELAVAQLGHLSMQMLLERLDNQVEVLSTANGRGRHRSLRAAFDTSYWLLQDPARTVLKASSVLHGAFRFDDLSAVCPSVDLDSAIRDLVTDSLYIADPGRDQASYQMLEPVRQCAYERLVASGEADEVHLRHAEHFLRRAPIEGETAATAADQGCISANLLAAHDWSVRTGHDELAARIAGAVMLPLTAARA